MYVPVLLAIALANMHKTSAFLLTVVLVALTAPVSLAFYSGSNVIPLNSRNFDKEVLQSGELWIVEFYAEWCMD